MTLDRRARIVAGCFVILAASSCQSPPSRDAEDRGFPVDDYPVAYGLGVFDTRFDLSEREFLKVVGEAKAVWEKRAGRTLFRYERDAPFRLNLVYDERQERTVEARKLKTSIDSRGRSYDALVWQHQRRTERLEAAERRYDEAAGTLRKHLEEHNERVQGWNAKGGAPADEYARLNAAQEELGREEQALKRLLDEVNEEVGAVNDLVAQINDLAEKNNLEITYFNGEFVESREFEQGVYTGRDITIYQFNGTEDLRIALAHEFGHALGFRHVDDPEAIMHHKLGKQNLKRPALASADVELLTRKFGGH